MQSMTYQGTYMTDPPALIYALDLAVVGRARNVNIAARVRARCRVYVMWLHSPADTNALTHRHSRTARRSR